MFNQTLKEFFKAGYTLFYTNKRLTLANILPQKRKVEDILSERHLKKVNCLTGEAFVGVCLLIYESFDYRCPISGNI